MLSLETGFRRSDFVRREAPTGLKEEKDGTWIGKAMHDGKDVSVGVDQTGVVTAK